MYDKIRSVANIRLSATLPSVLIKHFFKPIFKNSINLVILLLSLKIKKPPQKRRGLKKSKTNKIKWRELSY